MKYLVFTPEMKLADVIHVNYKLLLILPRFGISLGFGDKTVRECCTEQGIRPDFFVMACHLYTFDDYIPAKDEIIREMVDDLIRYLKHSHSYYLENPVAAIREQFHQIALQSDPAHSKILHRFFEEYKNELINHFRYEEEVVFPYIRKVANREEADSYKIDMFEENHSNIEEKLNDLKNIVIKYLPEKTAGTERIRLLFDIFQLEEDVNRHTLIENRVLIPLVHKLEKGHGRKQNV